MLEVLLVAAVDEFVGDLAGGDHHPLDLLGHRYRIGQHFVEPAADEFGEVARRLLGTQVALGRHQDQRLAELPMHLPAQDVEVLGGGGAVSDLKVVFGALLQEALQARRAVLWAHAFLAVRQHHHQARDAAPLRFRRGDELVDDDLGAVDEVAELRFPDDEHVRFVERVAVVEAEHRRF